MRPFSTEALILRRTNYGEADRILNMLTPSRGKVSVIAKGVRRPTSKLAGGLELFAVCDITIMEGRGGLGMVTSARLQRFFGNIIKDYDRMQFGYTTIALINRATETVAEPEFYDLQRDVLAWLDEPAIDYRVSELCFRLRLLTLLGHGLNMTADVTGKALQADTRYTYDFHEHAFIEDAKGRFISGHIKLLRLASSKKPSVLHHIGGVEPFLDECVWLVRTAEA